MSGATHRNLHSRRATSRIVLVGLLLTLTVPIRGETITFEGATGFVDTIGEFIDVGDYRFTLTDANDIGFLVISTQDDIVEPATAKMFSANLADVTLTRIDGAAFHFFGFDVGGSFVDSLDRWAKRVDVISSAGTYSAALSESDPVYTSHAPNYRDVTRVLFRAFPRPGAGPNDYEFTLDNLNVAPVPEASTLTLCGVALLSIVPSSWRRRRRRQFSRAISATQDSS